MKCEFKYIVQENKKIIKEITLKELMLSAIVYMILYGIVYYLLGEGTVYAVSAVVAVCAVVCVVVLSLYNATMYCRRQK